MKLLDRWQLFAYGSLGLPLAMAALPVYVHVPKLYGGVLGLELALVGAVLLGVRIFDAVQDPLLGVLADRHAPRGGRKFWIVLGLPLLAAGVVAVFHPVGSGGDLAAWLAGSLILAYLGYSLISISYHAWGAELGATRHERTRVTAVREALALVGVLLAAAIPSWLAEERGEAGALALFSLMFLPLLLAAAWLTLRFAPPAWGHARIADTRFLGALAIPIVNSRFRLLAAVFMLNGIAAAIPATLVLFFVQDVLGSSGLAGAYLAAYFLAGAAGMPVWVGLSRRIGKRAAWIASMVLAVAAFVWAFSLGPGDSLPFFVICVLSGLALGGDLALAPSLLADVIEDSEGGEARTAGAYFGVWSLLNKLNLALAAGIALPLLGFLGYQPGLEGQDTLALSVSYALLPCALKLAAAALLAGSVSLGGEMRAGAGVSLR